MEEALDLSFDRLLMMMMMMMIWKMPLRQKGPTRDSMCLTSPSRLVAIQRTVCFSPLLTSQPDPQPKTRGVKGRHQRDNDGLDSSAYIRAAQSTKGTGISTNMAATYITSTLFRQVHKTG